MESAPGRPRPSVWPPSAGGCVRDAGGLVTRPSLEESDRLLEQMVKPLIQAIGELRAAGSAIATGPVCNASDAAVLGAAVGRGCGSPVEAVISSRPAEAKVDEG